MTISCVTDSDTGALSFTINLTPTEADVAGDDATLMAELLDGVLWALGMLRSRELPGRRRARPG